MLSEYRHADFLMNGRLVQLSSVVSEREEPRSAFEKETFQFIRQWFIGENIFHQLTSGSTGSPKSIEISREQMLASARLTQLALGLKKDFTSLLCIDPKFIGGKMMLARSFAIGMKLICVEPSANPLSFLALDQWVNFTAFVPYQIENILGSKRPHSLDKVDIVIIGGSSLNPSTIEQLQNHTASCYATYGMTETISHIALRKLNGRNRQERFHTLPGIQLTKDDRGCLVIRAPYLSEAVVTNDLVSLDSSGEFEILGRWDNVINSGSIKVIPEKVEAAIQKVLEASGIKTKFFIHGLSDNVLGQKVTLIVEADGGRVVEWEQILAKVSSGLSRYEFPKHIAFVSNFSTTESGKINRLQTVNNIQSTMPVKYTD
jgi:O-succinylbenzoic acid--CoA ligase